MFGLGGFSHETNALGFTFQRTESGVDFDFVILE